MYNILSMHALQKFIDFIEEIKKYGLGHPLSLCPAYILIISGLCQKYMMVATFSNLYHF